jgi:hypothetical protein
MYFLRWCILAAGHPTSAPVRLNRDAGIRCQSYPLLQAPPPERGRSSSSEPAAALFPEKGLSALLIHDARSTIGYIVALKISSKNTPILRRTTARSSNAIIAVKEIPGAY